MAGWKPSSPPSALSKAEQGAVGKRRVGGDSGGEGKGEGSSPRKSEEPSIQRPERGRALEYEALRETRTRTNQRFEERGEWGLRAEQAGPSIVWKSYITAEKEARPERSGETPGLRSRFR